MLTRPTRWLLLTAAIVALSVLVDPSGVAQGGLVVFGDHLKCYKIKDSGKIEQEFVDLVDQFGFEQCEIQTKAELLCTSTVKDNFVEFPVAGDFLCYKVRNCIPRVADQDVIVADQFRKRSVELKEPKLLCAPAIKDP